MDIWDENLTLDRVDERTWTKMVKEWELCIQNRKATNLCFPAEKKWVAKAMKFGNYLTEILFHNILHQDQ